MQTQEQFISFNQHQIYTKQWIVDEEQKLSPIVLLHESLGSTELWKDFPEILAEKLKRNVISYDRIGFGQSSARNDLLALSFVADEAEPLTAVLDALALQSCILLGHSVGGGMAVAIGSMLKARCKAVITVAAQAYVEGETLDGIRHAAENACPNPKFIESLSRYHGEKTQWVLDAWTNTWLNPAFRDWNTAEYLEKLECLLLVIHGDQDPYATIAQPEYFIAKAKTKQKISHIMRGCGHFPHREKQDNLLQTLEIFLRTIQ